MLVVGEMDENVRRKARIALWMPWFAQVKILIFFSCQMAVTALAAPTAKGGFRTFCAAFAGSRTSESQCGRVLKCALIAWNF